MGVSPNPVPSAELRAFAASRLGPATMALLDDLSAQAELAALQDRHAAAEDALLALVFRHAPQRPDLAEEFLQFFFEDLQRLGHGRVAVGLRRFVETGDLVQSVVGDLWPTLFALEFRGRDAFLALLAARVRWKAADRARGLKGATRREDLRISLRGGGSDGEEARAGAPVHAAADTPGPMTELVSREEYEAMVLALNRLPTRESRLLRAHLAGQDWATIAAAEGLQPESARKAVQRALVSARAWWQARQEGRGES